MAYAISTEYKLEAYNMCAIAIQYLYAIGRDTYIAQTIHTLNREYPAGVSKRTNMVITYYYYYYYVLMPMRIHVLHTAQLVGYRSI